MGKTESAVAKAKASLADNFGEVLRGNANLITGFIAVVILVAGVGLMNGRASWWMTAAALTALFLTAFLYLNARVVIKAVLATVAAILMANFALQGGVLFAPSSSVGLVWMSAQLFLFVALIAASYLVAGHRSRWTGAVWACALALFGAALLSEYVSMLQAIALSMPLGFLVFFAYYRYSGHVMERSSLMPQNVGEEGVETTLNYAAEQEGWEIRPLRSKSLMRRREVVDYLVWNNEHAYVLHPVELQSKFSVSPSRKSQKLVHRGASINPWLLNLVSKRLPLWRSRNAHMMLVLLDVKSTNGLKAETIGVSLPDTGKKLPVGIYPVKGALKAGAKRSTGLLADIDKTYGSFVGKLTDKQRKAMGEIGRHDESEAKKITSPRVQELDKIKP